jgi:hypothetical protein
MTKLVEEAPTTCPLELASTSPFSRITACTTAWEVRIWALALAY